MYDTMGTQIENASIWHINSMFVHGEHMVHTSIGSCNDIAMIPLHDLCISSTMSCHDHIVPNMHCLGCCQSSPRDVSINAHEETPIVSSYILGGLDAFHNLHDYHDCAPYAFHE